MQICSENYHTHYWLPHFSAPAPDEEVLVNDGFSCSCELLSSVYSRQGVIVSHCTYLSLNWLIFLLNTSFGSPAGESYFPVILFLLWLLLIPPPVVFTVILWSFYFCRIIGFRTQEFNLHHTTRTSSVSVWFLSTPSSNLSLATSSVTDLCINLFYYCFTTHPPRSHTLNKPLR